MSIANRVAARYLGEPLPTAHRKTASFGPPQQEGSLSRNIPKNHEFNKKALKPLSKALWASTVALGHALTAHRHLSRLKSTTVSPDGHMGGLGYVMKLGDMRQKLFEAAEALSAISDTIYDEITAPHWKPKLAQLDEDDQKDVARFVEEAQEVMADPEGEAEEDMEEVEKKKPSKKKPAVEEDSSSLPTDQSPQSEPERPEPSNVKTASEQTQFTVDDNSFTELVRDISKKLYANSSLPVSELPGGPRVDHLGPGTGEGTYGDFNDETDPMDQWRADGGGISRRDDIGEDYDYPSTYENEMPATASSETPKDLDTPTDAWDFGIGYGAHGDGAGGYGNPSDEGNDKGVLGPHSGLPGTPPQSTGDTTRVVLDDKLNPRQADFFDAVYGVSTMPEAGPPSRSDYFPGPKDNMVSVGTSEMPSEERVEGVGGQPLINTYYTTEDTGTEYERYDYTTKTLREPDGDHPGQNHQEPWAPDGESTR